MLIFKTVYFPFFIRSTQKQKMTQRKNKQTNRKDDTIPTTFNIQNTFIREKHSNTTLNPDGSGSSDKGNRSGTTVKLKMNTPD